MAIQKYLEWSATRPYLQYQSMKAGDGFVDIKLQSKSSATFLVNGVVYKIIKIIHQPPPNPPLPPIPHPGWFKKKTTPASDKCGASITPEEVVATPGPRTVGQWYEGEQIDSQVGPHEGEVIRFSIHDAASIGARYLIRLNVVYGDVDDLKTECVPDFEIDVIE